MLGRCWKCCRLIRWLTSSYMQLCREPHILLRRILGWQKSFVVMASPHGPSKSSPASTRYAGRHVEPHALISSPYQPLDVLY